MTRPSRATRAAVLAELAEVADALEQHPRLLERRRVLFLRARELTPPVKVRELARVARVTEVAVTQQLRKAREDANQ